MYKESIPIYRDVNKFLTNLESMTKKHPGAQPQLIARYCFQGTAGQWFCEQASYLQEYWTRDLGILCEALYQKFDSKELQQQTKPANDIVRLSTPPRSETIEPAPKAMPAAATMPTPPSTPKAVAAERTPTAPTALPTPPATPPPSEPALMLTSPINPSESITKPSLPLTPPATPIATPKKPVSWAEIASRPVVAPKPSRLPIPTPKQLPKALETASITRSPTPHQKPYLTIDDLFKMFDGKHRRMDLLHSNHQAKKHASSPCASRQAKITSYFKPAANQKASISQGSKTPNPKSFHQLMPAESIRTKSLPPRETMPEKWTVSPYKMPSISYGIPFTPPPYSGYAVHQGRKCCIQNIEAPQQVSQSEASLYQGYSDSTNGSKPERIYAGHYLGRHPPDTPLMALIKKSNPHTCRRCFRAFRSNNDLHGHLRCTHLEHRHRRRSTERPPPGQRLDQPWRKV